MTTSSSSPSTLSSGAGPARPGLATAHLVVSGLLVAAVFVQAALAGQFLFAGSEIAVHGYIGNASFVLGLVGTALALAGRLPVWLLAVTALTALLMFAQTGLGYIGRDTPDAAAWHIPLGVAIFGLASTQLAGSVMTTRT